MVPCPCCPCTIDSDTFDTDLSKWTQESGSWSVGSGVLTHSGAGVLSLNQAATSVASAVIATTTPSTASGTAKMRLKVAWEDEDNYLFGELEYVAGVGTIRVGQVREGTERWLSDAESITEVSDPTISLCWRPGTPEEEADGSMFRYPLSGESTEVPTWTDPNDIVADDGLNASFTFSVINQTTGALEAHDLDFLIPLGSIINSVTVSALLQSGEATHEIVTEAVNLAFDVFVPSGGTITFGEAVPFAEGTLEWPGTSAEWGITGVDASDFNSDAFAATLEFTIGDDPDPPENAPMLVNVVAVEVFYTTPPRSGGRLYFDYNGTDCARAFGVHTSVGQKAALEAITGTWEWDDFTYSYHQSASRPDCPACDCSEDGICGTCCDPAFPPAAEYVVDLTGFNLDIGSDPLAGCECSGLDGFQILQQANACYWQGGGVVDCYALGNTSRVPWTIALRLMDNGSGGCKYRLEIIGPAHTASILGGDLPQLVAVYEATIADDESCQSMPLSLSKVFEFIGASCSGTLPATVSLDI